LPKDYLKTASAKAISKNKTTGNGGSVLQKVIFMD